MKVATWYGLDDTAEVVYKTNPSVEAKFEEVHDVMEWIKAHTERTMHAPGYWDTMGIVVTTYYGPGGDFDAKVSVNPWGIIEYLRKHNL